MRKAYKALCYVLTVTALCLGCKKEKPLETVSTSIMRTRMNFLRVSQYWKCVTPKYRRQRLCEV